MPIQSLFKAFICSSFLFTNIFAQSLPGTWVWIGGSKQANFAGIYGTKGVSSANNCPPAVSAALTWQDTIGNFWLYGGQGAGFYDHLWKYNLTSKQWTWVAGSNTLNQNPKYGQIGVPSASNSPGFRCTSATWIDKSGKFWLYGGIATNTATGGGSTYRDLWKYDPINNSWTWMKGKKYHEYDTGTYGVLGVEDSLNNPPPQMGMGISWVDDIAGNLWMLVENGCLWRYNIKTNNWAWMKGDTSQYYPNPVYGKKGVPSLNNTPGSTFYDYTRWKDSKGDFWYLYSRWPGYLKVLWRYEVAINSWTWMWGDTTFTDIYNYGGVPCHPHVKAINPLPRDLASACWTDACDNLWVMGGRAATKSSNPVLNDLLFYSTKNNRWSWVAGDFISKDSSSYGTLNVPSVFNYPSSRIWAHPFKDSLRNMCFFGGLGADGYHSFADIWSFTPDTNCTYCKIINTPPPPPPPPPTPTITTSDNTMLSDSDSRIPLIYPNPCDGKAALINIVLFSEINVYDQAGVLIFSRKNNSNTADIEIEEPGVYFIELVSGQKRQYLKLVVLTNK